MTSNPFATRHIRPGAVDYIFPPGQSAAALIERLRASGWFGQIIGPHGSGKSTLLAALAPALKQAGRTVHNYHLGTLRQFHPKDYLDKLPPSGRGLLVIDGYEQLSWWWRRRTLATCRRHDIGLLVTAHQDMGLPTLLTTEPTLALAKQVVRRLLGPDEATIAGGDVKRAWDEAGGNLREALFKLYDVYQARR